jgi:hypothetical protein
MEFKTFMAPSSRSPGDPMEEKSLEDLPKGKENVMRTRNAVLSTALAGGMLLAAGPVMAEDLPLPPAGVDDPVVTLEAHVPGYTEITFRRLNQTANTFVIPDASVATDVDLFGMDAHSNMERIHVITVGYPLRLNRNGLDFYLPYTMSVRQPDGTVLNSKAIGALPDYIWRTDDFLGLGGTGGVGAGWFGFDDRRVGLQMAGQRYAREGQYDGQLFVWIFAD